MKALGPTDCVSDDHIYFFFLTSFANPPAYTDCVTIVFASSFIYDLFLFLLGVVIVFCCIDVL